jgi:hypothetical protein
MPFFQPAADFSLFHLPPGKSEDCSKWDPRGIEPELTASRSVMHP